MPLIIPSPIQIRPADGRQDGTMQADDALHPELRTTRMGLVNAEHMSRPGMIDRRASCRDKIPELMMSQRRNGMTVLSFERVCFVPLFHGYYFISTE